MKYLFHTPQGYLTCRKIFRHRADGFTSPPKEVTVQIFIALKNPSSLAGFEPTNLGYSGKNNSHYTTEADYQAAIRQSNCCHSSMLDDLFADNDFWLLILYIGARLAQAV
jgi:hypothetical protein